MFVFEILLLTISAWLAAVVIAREVGCLWHWKRTLSRMESNAWARYVSSIRDQ
jgi:hypothetical protein